MYIYIYRYMCIAYCLVYHTHMYSCTSMLQCVGVCYSVLQKLMKETEPFLN